MTIEATLERIAVALERIAANSGGVVGNPTVIGTATPSAATASVADPLASTPVGASGASVTSDMLLALVQPLVQNETTKERVRQVLSQHGLNRLGEATEAQYQALYDAFVSIRDGGTGAAAASQDII